MKKQTNTKYSLGDLIASLFDEARKVASHPVDQKAMVHAALRHLLRTQVRTTNRISLQAFPLRRGTGGSLCSNA